MFNIDLENIKTFGPRTQSRYVPEGSSEIRSGKDYFFNDAQILRYLVARDFDLNRVAVDMKYHLEWRQTNVPVPLLQDSTLRLLKSGIMYIHGRCKDQSPILVVNFGVLQDLLTRGIIDSGNFCSLHNFYGLYI